MLHRLTKTRNSCLIKYHPYKCLLSETVRVWRRSVALLNRSRQGLGVDLAVNYWSGITWDVPS